MSGPYCKTCEYFHAAPSMFGPIGECSDPSKIMYVKSGAPVNVEPEVRDSWTCRNHLSPPNQVEE